jgi:hypothetical protein
MIIDISQRPTGLLRSGCEASKETGDPETHAAFIGQRALRKNIIAGAKTIAATPSLRRCGPRRCAELGRPLFAAVGAMLAVQVKGFVVRVWHEAAEPGRQLYGRYRGQFGGDAVSRPHPTRMIWPSELWLAITTRLANSCSASKATSRAGWTVGEIRYTSVTGAFLTAHGKWAARSAGASATLSITPVLCERRRRVRIERDLNPFAGISIGGDGTLVGWTIGAGLDYALTNNWFTGLEYRYSRTNPSHLYIRYRS